MTLPRVSTHNTTMHSTKSQLTSILEDRNQYVQKYFEGIEEMRSQLGKPKYYGTFHSNSWIIELLVVDDKWALLKGKKKKK